MRSWFIIETYPHCLGCRCPYLGLDLVFGFHLHQSHSLYPSVSLKLFRLLRLASLATAYLLTLCSIYVLIWHKHSNCYSFDIAQGKLKKGFVKWPVKHVILQFTNMWRCNPCFLLVLSIPYRSIRAKQQLVVVPCDSGLLDGGRRCR